MKIPQTMYSKQSAGLLSLEASCGPGVPKAGLVFVRVSLVGGSGWVKDRSDSSLPKRSSITPGKQRHPAGKKITTTGTHKHVARHFLSATWGRDFLKYTQDAPKGATND